MSHVPIPALLPGQANNLAVLLDALDRRSAVQRRAGLPGLVGRFRDEHRRNLAEVITRARQTR